MILARRGHKETLAWFPGMLGAGAGQGPDYRGGSPAGTMPSSKVRATLSLRPCWQSS